MRFARSSQALIVSVALCSAAANAQFSDDFDRTGELLQANENWTAEQVARDRLKVANNRVESNGTGSSPQLYRAPDQGDPDMAVQADMLTPAQGADYLVVRAQDVNNFIGLTGGTSNLLRLRIVEGGVIGAPIATASSSGVVCTRLEADGTTIRVLVATASCSTNPELTQVMEVTDVSTFATETDGGFRSAAASGTDSVALWDNFSIEGLNPPAAATYFVDPAATGNNDGTSPADAWTSIQSFNSASFESGEDVCLYNGTRLVLSQRLRNTTFLGTESDPAMMCHYHLRGGMPVFDFARVNVTSLVCSAGTVTVDTADAHWLRTDQWAQIFDADQDEYIGEYQVTVVDEDTFTYEVDACASSPVGTGPIIAQHDWPRIHGTPVWNEHDWNEGFASKLSDATLMAAAPPCANNGSACTGVGSTGLLALDYAERQYITIKGIGFGHSAGWGILATTSDNTPEPGLRFENNLIYDVQAQCIHISGAVDFVIEGNWMWGCGQHHVYVGGGSTRAAIAIIGDDPADYLNGLVIGNVIWDVLTGEGINTNRTARGVALKDNVLVNAGNLTCFYFEAAPQQVAEHNLCIHDDRAPYAPIHGQTVGAYLNNEEPEPPDWGDEMGNCNEAVLESQRTQNVLMRANIFVGWAYGYAPTSQATNKVDEDCAGYASNNEVYFDLNTILDVGQSFFRATNVAHVDENAMGEEPRLRGNVFHQTNGASVTISSAAAPDWAGMIHEFFYAGSLLSRVEWTSGTVITSGCYAPIKDYDELSRYMLTDEYEHIDSVARMRNFLRSRYIGLNPDDLTDRGPHSLKAFEFFGPGCKGSGPALTDLTIPSGLSGGLPGGIDETWLDARHQPIGDTADLGALQQIECAPCVIRAFQ